MQRLGGLLHVYTGLLQLIMQGDPRAVEMWNRMVIASGEPDSEVLIIKPEEAQQMAKQAQIMALLSGGAGKEGKNGKKGPAIPGGAGGGGATAHEMTTMSSEGLI